MAKFLLKIAKKTYLKIIKGNWVIGSLSFCRKTYITNCPLASKNNGMSRKNLKEILGFISENREGVV